MRVHLHKATARVSETLVHVAGRLPQPHATTRELIEQLGEQGLLMTCIVVSLPYLIPVSLPFASTVSGIIIILMAIGLATNSVPWLPRWILGYRFGSDALSNVLRRGAGWFARFEHWLKPRWTALARGRIVQFLHALALIVNGVLLLLPLPAIPLSNTLPGVGVMALAAGMLERDGAFVLAGWLLTVVSIVYFVWLGFMAVYAGDVLLDRWFLHSAGPATGLAG